MSSNLYFKKIVTTPCKNSLSDSLKFSLREIYGCPVNVKFDQSNVLALKGILTNHPQGKEKEKLREVIEMIEKGKEFDFFEEF